MTERFVIKYKNCDSNLDILQKIFTSYVKENNLKVKRGDLVIMLPVETEDDVKNENYKIYDDYDEMAEDTKQEIDFSYNNEYLYIIEKRNGEFVIVEFDNEEGQNVMPKNFVLYEEPDYFTQKHWIKNEDLIYGEEHYLWLTPTEEMLNTLIKIKSKKTGKYLRISTTFTDQRKNSHKINFNFLNKTFNIEEKMKIVIDLLNRKVIRFEVVDFENIDDSIIDIDV